MRLTRLISIAVLSGGLIAAVVPSQNAVAASGSTGSTGNAAVLDSACLGDGQTGLYLSKEGDATVTFSPQWVSGLAEAGITGVGTTPNQISADGTTMTLPVGEDVDNIELPSGHVCYPGGMVYSNPDTGATYEIKKFWIVFSPAPFNLSQFYAYPIVNGVQSTQKVVFANFSTPQGVSDIRPQAGGAVGPNAVHLYTNPDFVQQFNQAMGTTIVPGSPFADVHINWKGVPSKALPSTAATAGLKQVADAIKPFLAG